MCQNKGRKKPVPLFSETWRVFAVPWFWAAAVGGAALKVMDCYSAGIPFGIASALDAGAMSSALYFLDNEDENGLLVYIVVCLCTLPGASIYAEDCQKDALPMRVQRMGVVGYARARVWCAGTSAALAMTLADLLAALAIKALFGQNLLPGQGSRWVSSALLENGAALAYAAAMVWRHSMEAAFYSLAVVGMSAFLPNREALAALPVLLKYAFTYFFAGPRDCPAIAAWFPKQMYGYVGESATRLGVTEPVMAVIIGLYTAAMGIACGAVLCRKLKGRPRIRRMCIRRRHAPSRLRKTVGVAYYELSMISFSVKTWMIVAVSFIFMNLYIAPIVQFSADYGLGFPPVALVFYYSSGLYCNLGLLLYVFLVSDAPFRGRNQLYLHERVGCRLLCAGQMLALAVIAVMFMGMQALFSVAMSMPCVSFSGWGKVWGSIADGTVAALGYVVNVEVSRGIMSSYGPMEALCLTFVLVCLMGTAYGMVAYLLNNIGGGKMGTVALSIWSMAWLFLGNLSGNNAVRKLLMLSPQRWLNLDYLEPGEASMRIVGICLLICVLAAANIWADGRKHGE